MTDLEIFLCAMCFLGIFDFGVIWIRFIGKLPKWIHSFSVLVRNRFGYKNKS